MNGKGGAAVVIIYDGMILLRPQGKRFQLIGGKSHPNESFLNTAKRETSEESGLTLDPERMELIHTKKDKRNRRHTFFLYRLNETEANSNLVPAKGTKKPLWRHLFLLSGKKFFWRPYVQAIQRARRILNTNLLSYNPSPALT